MLRNRKAILPLLAVIFILFFDASLSAQCGAGKIPATINGYASILTVDNSFGPSGINSLGAPNGNGTNFSTGGQSFVIDLIDTVRAGQTYSITWRQYPGQSGTSTLNWSESLDGVTFTVHPSSGTGTTNERYFTTDFVAATDTRFIRFFSSDTYDLSIDAVYYSATKCLSSSCGPGLTSRVISGNGYYTDQASVSNPGNANYVPDGLGALFNAGSDRIVLRLPYAIPSGQHYQVIWRPSEDGAQMRIRESGNGSAWSPVKFSTSSSASSVFLMYTETTGTVTRYIEISGANNLDFYLDGIVFHAIACDPAAPDLDVDGTFEFCASPVPIAPGLVITDPENQKIRSAYVQFWDGFVPTEDRLSCTNDNGITSSYNSTYGVLSLTGEATTSEYQSVLRSLLYNNTSGTPTTGAREIIISLERYNPATGHYYIFVPNANISWAVARLQSYRTRLFGLQGYLVTVTSDLENNFLLHQMTGNTWLGGSDFYTNEGDWYWMTGPEAGTMFWQGDESGSELTYANWNPGTEPNNYNNIDEVFAHIYPTGSSEPGTWNDERANYNAAAYYVEFGDMPGDPALDITGTVNVNVVTGTPVSPSITGSNSVCPDAAPVTYSTTNVPGHNYFWEVTGGNILGGQGSNSITVDWGIINPGTVKVTESIGGACSVTTPDYSVFIGDNINPTITCPANIINVPANAGQCYATGVALGTPTSADNCGVASVTNNAPVQFPVGTTTVIWTVTDVNGRTATCNQTVTVVDTQDPTITCAVPAASYAADAGQCYYTVVGTALDPTATGDNCAVQSVVNNYNSTATLAGAQFPVGTTTVIWTVTDIHGNDTQCQYDVVVSDTQDPTIT
ncbi:MAG: HYR domain-containing protein, partial [Bacteroidales bacterium]